MRGNGVSSLRGSSALPSVHRVANRRTGRCGAVQPLPHGECESRDLQQGSEAEFPAPFLKWAGGKQWAAARIARHIPSDFGVYYEPFLGGGSVFFALRPAAARLADVNTKLIETYREIRDNTDTVIRHLSSWCYDKDFYYELRATRFRSPAKRAAQLLYLNRTCWNGLYRENRNGDFNVPFGQFKNPTLCDKKRLIVAGKALSAADLNACDFEDAVAEADSGDVVYFDPPYLNPSGAPDSSGTIVIRLPGTTRSVLRRLPRH